MTGVQTCALPISAMMSIHNQGADIVRSSKRGNYSKSESASRLFWTFASSALLLTMSRMLITDDDDKEFTTELTKETVNSVLGVFPLGDMLAGAIQGRFKSIGATDTVLKGIDRQRVV